MLYDLIVIGGGPAGYLAAERAGHAGLRLLLIEKRHIGGVCLNEGCIPSKALLYSAKIFDAARLGEKYGVHAADISLDHAQVMARKGKVVKTLVAGIKGKLKSNGVAIVEAQGQIAGRDAEGFAVQAGGEVHHGRQLLIATGSEPVMPPIPGLREGLDRGFVLTNREVLSLQSVPAALAVIGGGVIGLEMASYYNSVGSAVTVVEMLDRIGGMTDREIGQILMKNYQTRGVAFQLGAKVTAIGDHRVIYERGGQPVELPCEKVLLSIGRRAVTAGLGLESIGVAVERGAILTDAQGRTNVPGVYAAGDVNGKSMLAHTAYREAEVCVNTMLGRRDTMRYQAIPAVIYTNPEVASIGETAETAQQKGIDVACVTLSMRYSGRYVAENEGGDGIAKLVMDRARRTVLGVHLIGSYASEMIWGVSPLIETEMTIEDVRELVFPHPTVSEIIREAAFEI